MSFRFRKTVRIAPGIRLNLSSRGLSTTLGPRGLNVNVGKRGMFLNASVSGLGVSSRTRLGDGGGSGGGDLGAGSGGGTTTGCGCLGAILMLVLVGMCADASSPPDRASTPASTYGLIASAAESPPGYTGPREAFYIHGPLNVRSEPNKNGTLVRTLYRGARVQLGPKDAKGWAPYVDYSGRTVGYVYRASDNVRTYAPTFKTAAETSTSGSAGRGSGRSSSGGSRSSADSRGYYTGPRGGCYTYSASGRKRYVDRSYCN